jgi:hypothetical protein
MIGLIGGDFVEIREGLTEGEMVLRDPRDVLTRLAGEKR